MFHRPSKVPWTIIKIPLFRPPLSLDRRCFRFCQVGTYSTLSIPDIRSKLAIVQPSAISDIWYKTLETDSQTALDLRYEFYEKLRNAGLSQASLKWCIDILGSIPKERLRFADFLFAAELSLNQKDWLSLNRLLNDLSMHLPTIWEQITLLALNNNCPEMPPNMCLQLLGECCLNQNIDLMALSRDTHLPIMKMFQTLISKYAVEELISSLNIISEENMVMANCLSSALLRANSDKLIDSENKPPSPLDTQHEDTVVSREPGLSRSTELQPTDNQPDLVEGLWAWKTSKGVISSDDLKVYMMYLVYRRKCHKALRIYDSIPEIHDNSTTNEALLLAAAGAADYARLQAVFEEAEQDPSLIQRLGSRRYTIVLGALGYLGNSGVLNGIYENLANTQPNLITRGVFHALIHSHGTRGDLRMSRNVYKAMIDRGISPNYTTFNLMLQAYRDALDVKGAIDFIGNEMIANHQFALRNQELTMLISLCGKRRDDKSASYIWDWGRSLVKPDRISYNTYLHSLVCANRFLEARDVFDEMEERNFIGIDTLTIMLNAAGRSRNLTNYTSEFVAKKNELGLVGDDGWYLSLLSALAEWGDLAHFERIMSEMKSVGIKPHSSHYALYTELLTKTKQFSKHEKVAQEIQDLRIPVGFGYIEKQFRLLVAPGSSVESRKAAHLAALNLVRDGFFDPKSAIVPRGAIPVRVIEPVVKRLTKSGQYASAKQLLDELRKQRISEINLRDEYMVWALYLEIAEASQNFSVINKLWSEFVRTLPMVFVLSEGSSNETTGPVFKVATRYRKVFWKAVDIRIRHLQRQGDRRKLVDLPAKLNDLGLAMTPRNTNSYIIALANVGEVALAFSVAETARSHMTFNLSSRATAALASVANQVDSRNLNSLGLSILKLAENSSV